MNFKELGIKGVFLLTPNIFKDSRGYFNRSYCKEEFKKNGLECNIEQCNISENPGKGTLRGFHYQISPYEETKTISCLTGSIFNVTLDLREESPTFLKSFSIKLSSKSKESIFVPKGCANAWLTLEKNTILNYFMGSSYKPGFDKGIKFNDKFFNIKWPSEPKIISKKDISYADFDPLRINIL